MVSWCLDVEGSSQGSRKSISSWTMVFVDAMCQPITDLDEDNGYLSSLKGVVLGCAPRSEPYIFGACLKWPPKGVSTRASTLHMDSICYFGPLRLGRMYRIHVPTHLGITWDLYIHPIGNTCSPPVDLRISRTQATSPGPRSSQSPHPAPRLCISVPEHRRDRLELRSGFACGKRPPGKE